MLTRYDGACVGRREGLAERHSTLRHAFADTRARQTLAEAFRECAMMAWSGSAIHF